MTDPRMSYPNLPTSSGGGPSKVPIPRLHKQRSETPRKALINRSQNRVSRACLSCRSRKIKCNGLQPRCSNCSDSATACVYASSRKDRLKTSVQASLDSILVTEHHRATLNNQDLIALLRDLRQQVSQSGKDRIDDLLASVIDDVADAAATVQQHPADDHHEPMVEDERGEANVSAEVGSSGDLDLIDEDLMRTEETRATGFIGKASEIQWLRKLHGVDASNPSEGGPWGPPGEDDNAGERRLAALRERQTFRPTPLMQTSKASFYLDNEIHEADLMVDPLEMPQFETAEKLVQIYMESVHNSFPFLPKKVFLDRFYQYYASVQRGNPFNMDRQWQATLNMVFAIGAVYSHFTLATWRADERDHLLYHSRAWSLSLKDPWWFSHPDLPHMQITGLLSFYYLGIGHINRSWTLIGMAMRSGIALGMHIRNEDRSTGTAKKEILSRVWWAHYALDGLVSAMTGRPSFGVKDSCSIPHPLPLPTADIEDVIIESRFGDKGNRFQLPSISPGPMKIPTRQDWSDFTTGPEPTNSGSYLNSIVKLGEITQAALSLYGASTVSRSWESVQGTIANQNEALDAWASSLPEGLSFFQKSNVIGHQYRREQNNLEILYHSTKSLITRPCLCRLDRRIVSQTAVSNDFNQRAALLCIGAAKSIANLLPDAKADNLVELYQHGPWWQMVHVVMQALVILLLEVVYESTYFPEDRQEVMPSLKKLFRWLRVMRVNNGMAVRAYTISLNLLKKLVTMIKIDMTDLISEDELITAAAPSPAPSVPAQTHTPYPDILNPIHDTRPSAPSPASIAHARQPQQHYPHESHHQEPYQYQTSHLNPSSETFHPPSHYDNVDSELDFDAFNNLFLVNSGFSDVLLPGWFITSFDEQNPLPGFGAHDEGAGTGRQGAY